MVVFRTLTMAWLFVSLTPVFAKVDSAHAKSPRKIFAEVSSELRSSGKTLSDLIDQCVPFDQNATHTFESVLRTTCALYPKWTHHAKNSQIQTMVSRFINSVHVTRIHLHTTLIFYWYNLSLQEANPQTYPEESANTNKRKEEMFKSQRDYSSHLLSPPCDGGHPLTKEKKCDNFSAFALRTTTTIAVIVQEFADDQEYDRLLWPIGWEKTGAFTRCLLPSTKKSTAN